jgi:hypothetical protein
MFLHKIPLFNPAPLRKEILESMRDLAAHEQAARYSGHSAGILAGCGLFESDMNIGVSEGLVKFGGRVYTLSGRDSVPYMPVDAWTVLKIRFGGEERTRDFSLYSGRLVLDENTDILPNEMELGRFKLKHGSRLRTQYEDFQDIETEYDTVNLINVPYAAVGEPTISPLILTHFAREAYPLARETLDIAFCGAILSNGGAMSRESISQYLWRRLGMGTGQFSNKEMHRHLSAILNELGGLGHHSGPAETPGVLLL